MAVFFRRHSLYRAFYGASPTNAEPLTPTMPADLEWGFAGGGPMTLGKAILQKAWFGDEKFDQKITRAFVDHFLAPVKVDNWRLEKVDIDDWIMSKGLAKGVVRPGDLPERIPLCCPRKELHEDPVPGDGEVRRLLDLYRDMTNSWDKPTKKKVDDAVRYHSKKAKLAAIRSQADKHVERTPGVTTPIVSYTLTIVPGDKGVRQQVDVAVASLDTQKKVPEALKVAKQALCRPNPDIDETRKAAGMLITATDLLRNVRPHL